MTQYVILFLVRLLATTVIAAGLAVTLAILGGSNTGDGMAAAITIGGVSVVIGAALWKMAPSLSRH